MVKATRTKIADWIIAFICFLLILICLLPVLNILSRSLSSPLALVRNEVLLLPRIYSKDDSYEYIYRDGKKVEVTAIIHYEFNERTRLIEEKVYVVDEIVNENGETVLVYDLIGNVFDWVIYGSGIGIRANTGTELETLTVNGKVYNYTYDPETMLGTRIVSGAAVWRDTSENVGSYGLDFMSYVYILRDTRYTWSLAWTAMLTAACAVWSVFMTAICAYPLTYDHLKGRKFFNTMIILTMYFGAGTIPTYMLLKDLGLIDHPLVLALPFCLSVFNMIIMRSYFYGIPLSLRESAELDGAGPIKTLVFIYLPLSMPVIATLLLFYAVGRWNGYSDAMMFMNGNRKFYPIQYLLYNMIQGRTSPDMMLADSDNPIAASEAMRMSMVMFAMVPILCVYPFLQRYFIAGVTLGAVKE